MQKVALMRLGGKSNERKMYVYIDHMTENVKNAKWLRTNFVTFKKIVQRGKR